MTATMMMAPRASKASCRSLIGQLFAIREYS
jgi:hypothetical protein